MANEPARLPPLEALRVELNGLRQSPLLMLSPRNRGIVEMVDAYLVQTEARVTLLETRVAQLEGIAAPSRTYGPIKRL